MTAVLPAVPQIAEPEGATTAVRAAVDRLRAATVDAVAPTAALTMRPLEAVGEGSADLPAADRVVLEAAQRGREPMRLRVLPGAHEQLAEKTGIPRKYYDRMLEAAPELLAENVNTWFRREPANRLVRMLRPLTDADERALARTGAQMSVRAVLSDRYRPLDHGSLLDVVLPALPAGTRVAEWSLDDQRFHLRILGQERTIQMAQVGEVVSFGVAIRNSETGHAALGVYPTIQVLRCRNGMVITETLRVAHLGGRSEAEEEFLASETRRLDDAATFLKVRDRVIEIFAERTFERAAAQLAAAAGVPLPTEQPVLEFVENVGRRFDLAEAELGILKDEFLHEVAQTGAPTQWSVSQAVTATARRMQEEGGSFERRHELEQVGWRILAAPIDRLLKAGRN